MSWLTSLFGGGGSGSTSIWSAVLGGLSGAAGSYLSGKDADKAIREQGKETRRTLEYTAQLEDHYGQLDKSRKRRALDTYGQFSLMDRYAPNYKPAAPLDQPQRPGLT